MHKHFTYPESGLEDQTEVWPACLVALSQHYVSEQRQEHLVSSVVAAELAVAAAAAAVAVVAVVVVVVVVAAVAAAPCASVSFPLQGENVFL
jgi:hypothetical protein